MKCNIISIDDSRKAYKDAIRAEPGLEEVRIPAVNAHEVDLSLELKLRGLENRPWSPKIGELGVWLSNFDCWQWIAGQDEPVVVFEDDAILGENFKGQLDVLMMDLPEEWDYVSLWVPENQRADYTYNVRWNHEGDPVFMGHLSYGDSIFRHTRRLAHVYQGYGMVSLMYSPQGAAKLVELVRETGIYTPVDCFVYQQAHLGNLKGFAPAPLYANVVKYDWSAASHVQQTERAVV